MPSDTFRLCSSDVIRLDIASLIRFRDALLRVRPTNLFRNSSVFQRSADAAPIFFLVARVCLRPLWALEIFKRVSSDTFLIFSLHKDELILMLRPVFVVSVRSGHGARLAGGRGGSPAGIAVRTTRNPYWLSL